MPPRRSKGKGRYDDSNTSGGEEQQGRKSSRLKARPKPDFVAIAHGKPKLKMAEDHRGGPSAVIDNEGSRSSTEDGEAHSSVSDTEVEHNVSVEQQSSADNDSNSTEGETIDSGSEAQGQGDSELSERDIEVQIQKFRKSMDKVKVLEEQSKKRVDDLEKLMLEKKIG